jgi:hypothetical protein
MSNFLSNRRRGPSHLPNTNMGSRPTSITGGSFNRPDFCRAFAHQVHKLPLQKSYRFFGSAQI